MDGRGCRSAIEISWANQTPLELGLAGLFLKEKGDDRIYTQIENAVRSSIAGSSPVLPQVSVGVNPEALHVAGPVNLLSIRAVARLEMGLIYGAFALPRS